MARARGNHSSPSPRPPMGPRTRGRHGNAFRHAVQFFDDDASLAGIVADCFSAALEAGNTCVALTTARRRVALLDALARRALDGASLCASGRLVLLDAEESLDGFMKDGMPDPHLFHAAAARILGSGPVMAWGEMVDLLWGQGNADAALALERLWDDLTLRHRLRILCSYSMQRFDDQAQDAAFEAVCRHHSHVFPCMPQAELRDDEARRLDVARLQHFARSRDAAVRGRIEAERACDQLRHELDRTRGYLRDAVRIRDDFLSIALDELRNPLDAMHHQMNGIIRAAEQGRLPLTREWITYRIERTGEEATRLARTLDALLDVSRVRSGHEALEFVESDLADIVASAVARFRSDLHEPRLTLLLEPVPGRWDRVRVEQFMTQLVLNAIKYGMHERVEISVLGGDGVATISVEDHGTGVELAGDTWQQARLSRTPVVEDGAGFSLSLWIVRQLVESMHGSFSITPRAERGTVFSVTLPRHAGA